MPKLRQRIEKLNRQNIFGLIIIFIVAAIGVRLLTMGHAESPYASVEAESGTLAGGSSLLSDSNASGGKAVQFGSSSPAPTYPLKVVGNELEGSNGTRFVIKGVAQYWYTYDDSGSVDPAIANTSSTYYTNRVAWDNYLAAQGVNDVRIGVGVWEYNNQTYLSYANYATELQNLITSANSAGLIAQIGNWDSMGDGADAPTDAASWHPYWLNLKSVIDSDPEIMIEPFNEPNSMTEAQWLSMWESELSFWRGTAVGDMDYSGVIVVDTNNYSGDFIPADIQSLLNYSDTLPTAGNLLFSIHSYAAFYNTASAGFSTGIYSGSETNEQYFDSLYTQYESTYPMYIDETGNQNSPEGNGVGDYNDATSATSPEPYPEDPNNFFLWLSQFHTAMANDVTQYGLNGENAFEFSWEDYNCMSNYCYGFSNNGNPATPAWNPAWGQVYENYFIKNVSQYY